MDNMILVYTTCPDIDEAKKIAKDLLKQRLCSCTNIIPNISSMYLWSAKSDEIEESEEVLLLIKTLSENYQDVEKTIKDLHSYDIPAIFSIGVDKASKSFYKWLASNIE